MDVDYVKWEFPAQMGFPRNPLNFVILKIVNYLE